MATSSEEVLLIVKKVRQKKQDGALYLMAERIAWAPEGKDRFTVSHMYADIKCEWPCPGNVDTTRSSSANSGRLQGSAAPASLLCSSRDQAVVKYHQLKDATPELP